MNLSQLKNLSYKDLKEIADTNNIRIPRDKDESIIIINEYYKKLKKDEVNTINTYIKIKQLGNKGKEGIVYLVSKNGYSELLAMKTFKKTKSINRLNTEAYLQDIASKIGITPKVIEIDTINKYIVMEKLDIHLVDIMKKQNGNLTLTQQKQLIYIFKKLDECGVFQADSNIMNYMFKKNKLYIIDFGMSKYIDDKLIKKLGTQTPNLSLMNLGFILKLRELKCPESSYCYLIKFVNKETRKQFGLL